MMTVGRNVVLWFLVLLLTAWLPAADAPAPSPGFCVPIPSALKPYPSKFSPPPVEYRLWEGSAPDAPEGMHKAWNVGNGGLKMWGIPSVVVWKPLKSGEGLTAVLICPGGAYQILSTDWRNHVDGFLQDDYVVFMLKYRTVPGWQEVEKNALLDAKRAVRFIRTYASYFGVNPERIGVVGASAGSNLALNLITHPDAGNPQAQDPVDRPGSQVAFAGLLCPWPTPANRPVSYYPISGATPPVFVATAKDDKGAPTSWAVGIDAACAKAGIRHKLWQIEQGGHLAFHSNNTEGEGVRWRELFCQWLRETSPPAHAR